jgi:hypothetical protein
MAFNDWNSADPKEIPASCAKCHSTPGFLDFLGADGSAAGKVDKAAPIGTVITCEACHNDAAANLTSVTFPSGLEVTGLGPEARCMQCHQGRSSGPTLDKVVASLTDQDVVSSTLGFNNIHYFAAAATIYGTLAQGGYQYAGQSYDGKLAHVDGYNTCVGCHNPHTLKVKVDECATCHQGVTEATLKDIRMPGSAVDYNGNGNITEGIAAEIAGLQETLLTSIQQYANEIGKAPITYSVTTYPYFLGADGKAYAAWTARLLKAAYNYQVSVKDPGAFAHGGKYIIELLYDSIASLNEKLSTPVDMSKMHRIDAGHFAGSEMAFRDWDSTGEVPATCVRCHAPAGLPMYLKNGTTIAAAPGNGLMCATCHNDLTTFTRYEAKSVTFPSGATVDTGNLDANLCITCHQGRQSTASVNSAVKGMEADTVNDTISFRNVHYFAAGATLFGGDVQGAYQYPDKTYVGRNAHTAGMDTCVNCHDVHGLTVKIEACTCHGVKTEADLRNIRMGSVDYDGDGNTTEGIADEVSTYQEKLYAAIQEYAKTVAGKPIVYTAGANPYFFIDTNANGVADPDETASSNRYNAWTPRLLEAAYNYQYSQKDPGAFAHNAKYLIQAMYDSLTDLGTKVTVDMTGMTRP